MGYQWTRCPVGPLSATDLRARPVHSKSAIRTIWRSQVSILSLEARQHHTPSLRNRWVKSRPFHITPSCLRLRTARRRLRPCCIAIFIAPAVSTAALPVSSGADQSANPAQITSGTSGGAALANGIGSAAACFK